jgi:hypothetical protein
LSRFRFAIKGLAYQLNVWQKSLNRFTNWMVQQPGGMAVQAWDLRWQLEFLKPMDPSCE